MMIPRDYQTAADEALWRALHQNHDKNPLVVMATGLGKSLSIAMFCWRMIHHYPSIHILNVTHVKELVEGNYKTMRRLWPTAPVGVYSAGLGRKETRYPITFCGIQSVVKKPGSFGHVDFVVIDEAHRMSPNAEASYGKFIKALKAKNPNLIVIGFTATPFRMKGGKLTDHGLFDYEVFNLGEGESFVWAIENGYLIKPVPKDPGFQLSDEGLRIQAGDFVDSEVSAAFREQGILENAVLQMIELGQDRKAWLTFCQSIDDAELVADIFRFKGYPVEAVHSKMSGDRDDVLAKFKRGELRGVTNRDILTTGFDYPAIDMIGMLRMTRSPGLWVQMLGRGTRPVFAPGFDINTLGGRKEAILASDKQTCLVLDYVGNTERLGPINYPTIPGPKRKKRDDQGAPVRCCPECDTYHHVSIRVCDQCGYEFPPPASNVRSNSSCDDLVVSLDLTLQPPPREYEIAGVHRMVSARHKGKGNKPDTMKVDYFCSFQRFSTWVCFDHPRDNFAYKKACEWWDSHGGQKPHPESVEQALARFHELNKPKFIKVWTNTRYPEIIAYDFRGTQFNLPPEAGGPALQDPGPDPVAEFQKQAEAKQAHFDRVMGELTDLDTPF